MRTTVVIDSDVAAEIERLRRGGPGVSEALNLLARPLLNKRHLAYPRTDHARRVDVARPAGNNQRPS